MNPANMSALTTLLMGNLSNDKDKSAPEPQAAAPDFKTEASKLIPITQRDAIKKRLRFGEPIEGIFRELQPTIPNLKLDHIKALAGQVVFPAGAQAPTPAPEPAKPTKPEFSIGDYFMNSVLGSSSATLRNPVIPVNTSGRRPGGNTGNPRTSVRSTSTYGTVTDAAKALEAKFTSLEATPPAGFPRDKPINERIKWIIDSGTREVNSANKAFVIRGDQFVPRATTSVPQVTTATAPTAGTSEHVLPRSIPEFDTRKLHLDLYDPTRSANLLKLFNPVIAGAKATNKSMGQQLEVIHGMASGGRDLGIWGKLAVAYANNQNNAPARELIISLAKGIHKIATANQDAVSRGWTVGQTKPLVDAFGATIDDGLARLREGNTNDIQSFTRKLNSSFTNDKALSAFTSSVHHDDFSAGTHVAETGTRAPLISTQNIAPIILSDAGKVVRNQLAGQFAKTGGAGYHEATQAAANFIDAVINNPETPIAKRMSGLISDALSLSGEGQLNPKDLNNLATYVAMRRSNKAQQQGPVVNSYIANIINHLNLPKMLIGELSATWRNDAAFTYETDASGKKVKSWRKFADDFNAAAEMLRKKGGTDWTDVYHATSPWLNESILGNVFPKSWNEITKNTEAKKTKARLEEGTQYTPERANRDLIINGLKQSILTFGTVPANQMTNGVFAGDTGNDKVIANLGTAGVGWLKSLPAQTYNTLIDMAFTDEERWGKNKSTPRLLPGLSRKITPDYVANRDNLTPTIANRLIHAILNPQNSRANTQEFVDMLKESGSLKGVSSLSKDQAPRTTVIPKQSQRVQISMAKPKETAAFTDEDFDQALKAYTDLNYTYKGGGATEMKMRQAANYKLQRLMTKLKDSVRTQSVKAGGVGATNKTSASGNESLATVQRLMTAYGDQVGNNKAFPEFKQYVEDIVGHETGTKRRNVKDILGLINSLPEREKVDALKALNPNSAYKAVSFNPLGLSNQEMRDFGVQLDALIKTSPKAPQLIDLSGTLGPGVRILRKLSGDDGLKTLQIINDIAGVFDNGVPLHGPRPASMGAYNDPTARAALRTVAGESKAARASIADITKQDPIEGAGLQLQRSMISSGRLGADVANEELKHPRLIAAREKRAAASKIGEKGPTGKGFRNLLGIGGAGILAERMLEKTKRQGGK